MCLVMHAAINIFGVSLLPALLLALSIVSVVSPAMAAVPISRLHQETDHVDQIQAPPADRTHITMTSFKFRPEFSNQSGSNRLIDEERVSHIHKNMNNVQSGPSISVQMKENSRKDLLDHRKFRELPIDNTTSHGSVILSENKTQTEKGNFLKFVFRHKKKAKSDHFVLNSSFSEELGVLTSKFSNYREFVSNNKLHKQTNARFASVEYNVYNQATLPSEKNSNNVSFVNKTQTSNRTKNPLYIFDNIKLTNKSGDNYNGDENFNYHSQDKENSKTYNILERERREVKDNKGGKSKRGERKEKPDKKRTEKNSGSASKEIYSQKTASEAIRQSEIAGDPSKITGYWEKRNKRIANKTRKMYGDRPAYWTEDIQVGCRELFSRRYITDGFCTSEKPIKEVVCAGHCLPIRQMPWYAEFVKTIAASKLKEWQCVEDRVRMKRIRLLCKNAEYRYYRIKVVKSCKCEKITNQHNRTGRDRRRKRKKKRRGQKKQKSKSKNG